MYQRELLKNVQAIIDFGKNILESAKNSDSKAELNISLFYQFRTAALSFLVKYFDKNHPYYKEFDNNVTLLRKADVQIGIGIIKACYFEIKRGGYTVMQNVTEEDMQQYLLTLAGQQLDLDNAETASSIVFCLLSVYLRLLSLKNGLCVDYEDNNKFYPKDIAALSFALTKQKIHSMSEEKLITHFIELKDTTYSGNNGKYSTEVVRDVINLVSNYIQVTKLNHVSHCLDQTGLP